MNCMISTRGITEGFTTNYLIKNQVVHSLYTEVCLSAYMDNHVQYLINQDTQSLIDYNCSYTIIEAVK
jgi:hypothetical protein